MTMMTQWLETENTADSLVAQASPHMCATYQIYKDDNGRYEYEAVMWDGTSLIHAVHIAYARSLAAAKRALSGTLPPAKRSSASTPRSQPNGSKA
jgi:hypothetical protein